MKSYSWIVLTNCAEGQETAYEAWYNDIHIPDLLRVPGVTGVSMGRVANCQTGMHEGLIAMTRKADPSYAYLAVYKFQTTDPEAVLAEVVKRSNTPEMLITPDLVEAYTILFEDV